MNNSIIGIFLALGISNFLLYTRKKKWTKPHLRWLTTATLFVIGFLGLLLVEDTNKANRILFWCLCVPWFYYCTDRLFRFLSLRIYNRDFVLWLRGSDEIDGSLGGKNPHVKPLDIVFSLGLLILIMVSTLIGVVVFN